MKPILIGVPVECKDGRCGKVKAAVLDPATMSLSMIVVESHSGLSHLDVLVPMSRVADSSMEHVALDLSRDQLALMEPYLVRRYISTALHDEVLSSAAGLGATFPSLVSDTVEADVDDALTPAGHVVFGHGCDAYAQDEKVGIVAGFGVEATTHVLTHVFIDHGHAWHRTRTVLPAEKIAGTEGNTVNLSLGKHELESM